MNHSLKRLCRKSSLSPRVISHKLSTAYAARKTAAHIKKASGTPKIVLTVFFSRGSPVDIAHNAAVKEPKYVGVAFALFAKGMTTYFGLFLPVC